MTTLSFPYRALVLATLGQFAAWLCSSLIAAAAIPCCDNPTPPTPAWYAFMATPIVVAVVRIQFLRIERPRNCSIAVLCRNRRRGGECRRLFAFAGAPTSRSTRTPSPRRFVPEVSRHLPEIRWASAGRM